MANVTCGWERLTSVVIIISLFMYELQNIYNKPHVSAEALGEWHS